MDISLKFGAVGVMDSGIGGLNVLNALAQSFPKLNFVYFGDNENAPYGNKSLRELKRLILNGIDELILNNAKIIIVACNTLSSTLLDYIKAVSPVPVIPTLPNPYYDKTKFKTPCLIATPNTISSKYVKENFKSFNLVPLPFLAGEIEHYVLNPCKISVEKDLTALPENIDYLYIGCTHYLFVKERIISKLNTITVSDNLDDVVKSLNKILPNLLVKKVKGRAQINFVGNSRCYNLKVYKTLLWSKGKHKIILNP